jgi:hypothetical protein
MASTSVLNQPRTRVYFDNNGHMNNFTTRNWETIYVGKKSIPLYTLDELVDYKPNTMVCVFIASDPDGDEVTVTMDSCHVDLCDRKTYIYCSLLHRVFKFELQDTLFLFEDFSFFGDVLKQMCGVIPDYAAQKESLKLW